MSLRQYSTTQKRVSSAMVFLLLVGFSASSPVSFAQSGSKTYSISSDENLDLAMLTKIKDEGLNRSQVMDHLSWLSDVYGPRLTGSPTIKQASGWVQKRFKEWGLSNIHEEPSPFGKGWSLEHFSLHLLEPQTQPIMGYPKAWSSGTEGPVTAEVVYAPIRTEADIEKFRGKLKGKIVLTQPARDVRMLEGKIILRMTDEDLKEAQTTPIPKPRQPRGGVAGQDAAGAADAGDTPQRGMRGPNLQQKINDFFLSERVVATFDRGSDSDTASGGSDLSWVQQHTDGGTFIVQSGGPRDQNAGKVTPSVVLAVEHYNRMIRVLEKGLPVKVELEIKAKFYDEASMNGFNVVGEIPGSDLANEVVMIGAHFDSWHSGTGATDNGCGDAAMMEVMRILKAVGAKPRRTIRIALWGGEEEGLLGSRAYVKEHFADPVTMQLKPDHEKLAAYFNLDNGSGRVRGIWMQNNMAVEPIFQKWIEPLHDLGVTTLGPRSVVSTDHVPFDAVGLPGFQFMVDRLEYNSRTHHTNMDVYDRAQREDMVQMATVVACFTYNAAMRNEKLPRKPLPAPSRREQ